MQAESCVALVVSHLCTPFNGKSLLDCRQVCVDQFLTVIWIISKRHSQCVCCTEHIAGFYVYQILCSRVFVGSLIDLLSCISGGTCSQVTLSDCQVID